MSKKQWLVLLMLFLTYLLLGASIFYHIESQLEIERVETAKHERIEINALLHAHYLPSVNHNHDDILGKLTRYCGKSVYNYTEGETDPLKWDFYNSFYFAYTVVSTIGYGNLAPTNMLGRILMIFYGLIGIPMNGILLTQLGEFFGNVFVRAHEKYKSYKRAHLHARDDYYPRKLHTLESGKVGLAAQIFVHLMPGFVMFIFFPAFLFSHYEGWSYDEAVYYAFVTLTTIGFGDYVAGQDNSKGSGFFFMLYKSFLICWISFGLGYTVMIMTFIARGMRSKKIIRIEHKLAINLKHTQSKIWNEFNKEMNYLRRVFNELQLSKVKRVYVDECAYETPPSNVPRSNSFPDLRDLLYGSKQKDFGLSYRPRRRANSEIVPKEDQVTRVVSETDLQRIDKEATFATHAMVQPAELLARLVNILGYIPPATEDATADASNQTTYVGQDSGFGYVGKKGRLEENGPAAVWTIGQEKLPRFAATRPRSRAISEIRLHETRNEDRNVERTWSGPTAARKIQQLMKRRASELSGKDRTAAKETKFSKLRNFAFGKSVPKALVASSAPWRNRFSTSSAKKEEATPEESFRAASQQQSGSGSLIDDRRDSSWTGFGPRSHYYTHTGAANQLDNDLDNELDGASALLEETSLADFLRALTVIHATVASNSSDADQRIARDQPRRKMGTASLTPPKLPSLFTLFSPSPPVSTSQSNQNTITQESGANWNENKPPWTHGQSRRESRRGSLAFPAPTALNAAKSRRRFSLRPVATPISPPTPPNRSSSPSPFLSDRRRTKSTFFFESPKEPLIRTEGTPGLSTPIKPPLNGRRFSLRPTQNIQNTQQTYSGAPLSTGAVAPALKAIPRWKAGMLQRQIGQMNLRRRVRAFSLSDVHAEDLKEPTENAGAGVTASVQRSNRFPPSSRPDERSAHTGPDTNASANNSTFSGQRSDAPENPITLSNLQTSGYRSSSAIDPAPIYGRPPLLGSHAAIESPQPLLEVKTENPGSSRSAVVTAHSPRDMEHLAEIKIEKDIANMPLDKS